MPIAILNKKIHEEEPRMKSTYTRTPFEQALVERQSTLDMLDGCYCRLHVSDDPDEIKQIWEGALRYCDTLAEKQAKYAALYVSTGRSLPERVRSDITDYKTLCETIRVTKKEAMIAELCKALKDYFTRLYNDQANWLTNRPADYDDYM